jgi:hypothetical protein
MIYSQIDPDLEYIAIILMRIKDPLARLIALAMVAEGAN